MPVMHCHLHRGFLPQTIVRFPFPKPGLLPSTITLSPLLLATARAQFRMITSYELLWSLKASFWLHTAVLELSQQRCECCLSTPVSIHTLMCGALFTLDSVLCTRDPDPADLTLTTFTASIARGISQGKTKKQARPFSLWTSLLNSL